MFNLVIFGPPGSGKGTQSENIINKYGLVHLSTGDLLRAEKNSGSELGNKIKELIDNGNLVPDSLVEEMVKKNVTNNKEAAGFIFDGFPRTVAQAETLDRLLAKHGRELTCMVQLEVPEEELMRRLLERAKIQGRADDNEATINNRLREYANKTLPVAKYYAAQGKQRVIDGLGSIEDIADRIKKAIQ